MTQTDESLTQEKVTFSFGENWQDFLGTVTDAEVASAREDITYWLGDEFVAGKRVVDVGSGSGLHSACFHLLGASEVLSFDYDPNSVAATEKLWQEADKPQTWRVTHGSILDTEFVRSLGEFNLVYSWGVLHHTGSMWEAIDNALSLVAPNGHVWISLYSKGDHYPKHLELKRKYNSASDFGKRMMVWKYIARRMASRAKRFKNPFAWNKKVGRGMNVYNDIVDWLGGLPYEVAGEDEVVRFARDRGFVLDRIMVADEGACSTFVLSRMQ